jgi:hypothetical protein
MSAEGNQGALAVLDEVADWLYRSSEGRGDDERAERVRKVRVDLAKLIDAARYVEADAAVLGMKTGRLTEALAAMDGAA